MIYTIESYDCPCPRSAWDLIRLPELERALTLCEGGLKNGGYDRFLALCRQSDALRYMPCFIRAVTLLSRILGREVVLNERTAQTVWSDYADRVETWDEKDFERVLCLPESQRCIDVSDDWPTAFDSYADYRAYLDGTLGDKTAYFRVPHDAVFRLPSLYEVEKALKNPEEHPNVVISQWLYELALRDGQTLIDVGDNLSAGVLLTACLKEKNKPHRLIFVGKAEGNFLTLALDRNWRIAVKASAVEAVVFRDELDKKIGAYYPLGKADICLSQSEYGACVENQ